MRSFKLAVSIFFIISVLLIVNILNSCSKESDDISLPVIPPSDSNWVFEPTPYEVNLPSYFPVFIVPEDNPTTVQGINMGRHLYYDPLLSEGGPLSGASCSSCHYQSIGFTSPSLGASILPHINLNYWNTFLWNGKIEGQLEDIMEFEVNEFFEVDIELIAEQNLYQKLSYEAFGTTQVTEDILVKALAQFFRVLNSSESKFDQFYQGEDVFDFRERRGLIVFNSEKGDCFHCHSLPLFTDHRFHNIGLDSVFNADNEGRSTVTGDPADNGKFKVPTLRNIGLTAPYMHDGRFATLDEVIDHYDHGVKHSESLDPIMTKPGKENGLNLTNEEKEYLKAFLLTLTDTSFTNNPLLSDPF